MTQVEIDHTWTSQSTRVRQNAIELCRVQKNSGVSNWRHPVSKWNFGIQSSKGKLGEGVAFGNYQHIEK